MLYLLNCFCQSSPFQQQEVGLRQAVITLSCSHEHRHHHGETLVGLTTGRMSHHVWLLAVLSPPLSDIECHTNQGKGKLPTAQKNSDNSYHSDIEKLDLLQRRMGEQTLPTCTPYVS